jgi:ribosomal protein S27E
MSRRQLPYPESAAAPVLPALAPQDRDMCICEQCSSELVEPTAWEADGEECWRVALRCPNCEHTTDGVFTQACVDRFDMRLDDGTAALVTDLKRLEHANMIDDVERFIGALRSGAIAPEDF